MYAHVCIYINHNISICMYTHIYKDFHHHHRFRHPLPELGNITRTPTTTARTPTVVDRILVYRQSSGSGGSTGRVSHCLFQISQTNKFITFIEF